MFCVYRLEEIRATFNELQKVFSTILFEIRFSHKSYFALFRNMLSLLFYTAARLKECSSSEAISINIDRMWKEVSKVSNGWINRFYSPWFGRHKQLSTKLQNGVEAEIEVLRYLLLTQRILELVM